MFRVTLVFTDAGLFQRPLKPGTSEHLMLTPGGVVHRKGAGAYTDDVPADTILHSCVVNMFRVLLGVRPVPTFRGSTAAHAAASTSTVAERMAEAARITIESGLTVDTRDKSIKLIREPQRTGKAWGNAWALASIPWAGSEPLTYRVSWRSVESEFGADLFKAFTDLVTAVLGTDARALDMVSVFGGLYKSKDKRVLDFCSLPGVLSPYREVLVNGKSIGQFFGHSGQHGGLKHWMYDTEPGGVGQVSRRSGKIVVDVEDEDIALFDEGCGFATLLDGGVVKIASIDPVDACDRKADGVPTYKLKKA